MKIEAVVKRHLEIQDDGMDEFILRSADPGYELVTYRDESLILYFDNSETLIQFAEAILAFAKESANEHT
jgi:hypothetical protein